MKLLANFTEKDMDDLTFSRYLYKHGPWEYEQLSIPATKFIRKKDNKILAIVTYDNSKCTRRIYLPQEGI